MVMYSIFDIFKVGIGPSSSHTLGPMKAALDFRDHLLAHHQLSQLTRLSVSLHGSLALTGKGHHSDTALVLGLLGETPEGVAIDHINTMVAKVEQLGGFNLGEQFLAFTPGAIAYISEPLPRHENGLCMRAFIGDLLAVERVYYSIGGGFVVTAEQFSEDVIHHTSVPYSFASAQALTELCHQHGISISGLMRHNELAHRHSDDLRQRCLATWQVMQQAIERGTATEGLLAGPLRVPRRAAALKRQLESQNKLSNDPMVVLDWVNMFALAVSEENAAGGRIVTSPTNGAAGIIPAVLAYYEKFVDELSPQRLEQFFLTAAAVAMLFKMNASISGAEVGCQGEIGVSCAMAAAGLSELMGGNPEQVLAAAEIAMEHHLGLTCDPVAGQVQVPCIERNAVSAIKAINASRMALRRNSRPCVSLDRVIEAMYETGKDMHVKYRETSQGGLAIKVAPACR